MTLVVLSPHCDDAIWSVGEHLLTRTDDIVIATPFAGIPDDEWGRRKHLRLNEEHEEACERLCNTTVINGPFLDDVYPDASRAWLNSWLRETLFKADEVWVPLGIHHPDHLLVHTLVTDMWNGPLSAYEELPYKVRWSAEAVQRWIDVGRPEMASTTHGEASSVKESLVRLYESQVKLRDADQQLTDGWDEQLIADIMQPELVWRLK